MPELSKRRSLLQQVLVLKVLGLLISQDFKFAHVKARNPDSGLLVGCVQGAALLL